MDHHTVAAVSITGTCLDVLGSLYLAYDLLGGQHGPLRLLTRAVTYSIVFGIGYGLGLGLFFGLASGIATGITLSIEFNRAARGLDHYLLPWEGVFSAIRGFGFGAGLYRILGLRFAAAFAILITVGQILAYSRGMRPAMDYVAARRPRLTRRQFWGTVVRTFGYIASAVICSAFIRHVDHAWSFAIRVGLVTGIVTGIGATVNPYIEYYADNLPERRLGVFGIGLIFCGFALQSLQYWLALFDVHLTQAAYEHMSDRGLQMAFIERNQVIEKLDYEPQLNMERAMAPPPKRRAELCRCILGLSRHIGQPSSEQSGGKHQIRPPPDCGQLKHFQGSRFAQTHSRVPPRLPKFSLLGWVRTSTQNLSLEQVCSSDVYGPGQYDRRDKNRNAFYLPLARSLCKVKLTFGGKKILAVEPGPAFDPAEWKYIRGDVEKALFSGAPKVGREYSFCTFRATGWWRGTRSGVQIIQPHEDAPRAGLEGADHPFILEFPLKASALQEITNQRRIRVHRQLTLLLNVLLRGATRPSSYLDRGTFGQPISIMGLRANGFVGGLQHRYDRVT